MLTTLSLFCVLSHLYYCVYILSILCSLYFLSIIKLFIVDVSSRWKRLRSCIIEKDLKLQNNRKDWSQFNTDLDNINKWLKARDNWLNSINVSELSIPQMGGIIKELKVSWSSFWVDSHIFEEDLSLCFSY